MKPWLFLAIALTVVLVACGGDDDDGGASPTPAANGAVVFASEAFSPGGEIPLEFSCAPVI